jgi:hypothetical protein
MRCCLFRTKRFRQNSVAESWKPSYILAPLDRRLPLAATFFVDTELGSLAPGQHNGMLLVAGPDAVDPLRAQLSQSTVFALLTVWKFCSMLLQEEGPALGETPVDKF